MPSAGSTSYWHGLGLCLNPAAIRQIDPRCDVVDPLVLACQRTEPDHDVDLYTHASIDREVALAFSVLSKGSIVCEVDPGPLTPEHDPDFPTLGVRFRGPLTLLAMHRPPQNRLPHARRVIELLAADRLNAPNQRWHHPDGRIQPPPLWRAWDYTEDDFDWLGPWFPDTGILHNLQHGLVHAVTESGHQFTVWPAARPLPARAQRIKPTGTLHHLWRTPGKTPDGTLVQRSAARRPLFPWEW